jgi:hypothetical protein
VAFIDPIQPVPRGLVAPNASNFIEQRQWFEYLRDLMNIFSTGGYTTEEYVDNAILALETTIRITSSQTLTTDFRNWFVNTDGGAVALALPAGAPTNYFRIVNCGSSGNKITITPDGTEKLKGVNAGKTLSDGSVVILAFETTEGWW